MAWSAEVVAELRRLIDDKEEPYQYNNETLQGILDITEGDTRKAASRIWREKAASYVELVDTTEGAARRNFSKLTENALKMANDLDPPVVDTPTTSFSTTRAIVRL